MDKELLTLDMVKVYLRVDESDEDQLINQLIEFSKEDIFESTGATFEEFGETKLYQMLQKVIIVDRYENRSSSDVEYQKGNIYSSLCTKLRVQVE